MSNERRYECLPQEHAATADTTNCSQKRASLPTCSHVATSKMNVQSQRTSQPLDQVFAAGKTLGLDHRDQIERLPSKILRETRDVSALFSCGLLATVDHLTLLACTAKKAHMSISVSLSQKQRRLVRLLLWPLPFFDPCVLPLLLLSRSLLLPRPRPLPLLVRFFRVTLLLPVLDLPVLLARPEAFEATEAFDLADFWLVREVDLTLVLEFGSP